MDVNKNGNVLRLIHIGSVGDILDEALISQRLVWPDLIPSIGDYMEGEELSILTIHSDSKKLKDGIEIYVLS